MADPGSIWPDLGEWFVVKVAPPVSRVRQANGEFAFVRPDDGSADVLRRLAGVAGLPIPAVLAVSQGWLLMSALPGVPLHDVRWRGRPDAASAVAAEALRCLEVAGITHGDMCIPNILGDLESERLTGIVDWGLEGQFSREIDVASTVWSLGFNGYEREVAVATLRRCGWPRADVAEVTRLAAVWRDHAGPVDMDLLRRNADVQPPIG